MSKIILLQHGPSGAKVGNGKWLHGRQFWELDSDSGQTLTRVQEATTICPAYERRPLDFRSTITVRVITVGGTYPEYGGFVSCHSGCLQPLPAGKFFGRWQ